MGQAENRNTERLMTADLSKQDIAMWAAKEDLVTRKQLEN
jgi:hypothetical protein